ncbi:MAG TPA: phosphopentomutase [Gemmatimonadaceae bacterium]|jgi:phosphopentomutase|nr:phosphopentomutase [Gemmatimonadaceae bacterium]
MSARRAILLVLDGVGIGAAHDAAHYGDEGSDTLGNIARAVGGLELPHLEALGLGCIAPLAGVSASITPRGAFGCMQPASSGKDSTTGHWELCGVHLERPFPVYPNGFPSDVTDAFAHATGRAVIGNIAASGTEIIERYAEEQRRTGAWIVYTSADSVFQVAADEGIIPLAELYAACEVARAQLVAPHNVSRVIARPFLTEAGSYRRTANRRDFSVAPVAETLLDMLARSGVDRRGVGKVDDLFARRNIQAVHTENNDQGIAAILAYVREAESGLCFANLVDFDQQYGHRNDIAGFYGALRGFDRAIPTLVDALREDDLLIITADHGTDPTTRSTDHSRERVPLLVVGPRIAARSLGERSTFSDAGATVADWFRVPYTGRGRSFLSEVTA